jgi:hypothetical protein
MPLVRISVIRGKPAAHRRKLGDEPGDLVYDPEYLGIGRVPTAS